MVRGIPASNSLAFSAHFESKATSKDIYLLMSKTGTELQIKSQSSRRLHQHSSKCYAPYFTGISTCVRDGQRLPAFRSSTRIWRGPGFHRAAAMSTGALGGTADDLVCGWKIWAICGSLMVPSPFWVRRECNCTLGFTAFDL